MMNATRNLAAGLATGLSLSCSWTAAQADPVTYRGTLGTLEIVVELTGDPESQGETPSGRYFYRDKGIDIPLHFVRNEGGVLELVEEEPCDRDTCPEGSSAPLGATWKLRWIHPDAALKGEWKGTRSFPVTLQRVGGRVAGSDESATPLGLFEASSRLTYSNEIIDRQTHPYDFLRLDIDPVVGETTDWNGAAFTYVTDPRTQFIYPRVSALPNGASPDRVNELLRNRHWERNIGALTCAALRYVGFHAYSGDWDAGYGSLGGFEDTTAQVTQLTARALSWTESGSVWCGGGSPSNFYRSYLADVQRGEMLEMRDIFRDWGESGPGNDVLDFVRSRREKPKGEVGIEAEHDCGTDDLMESYLSARLVRSDGGEPLMVFGIYGLPTVIAACSDDLLTLPLEEVGDLLRPETIDLLR